MDGLAEHEFCQNCPGKEGPYDTVLEACRNDCQRRALNAQGQRMRTGNGTCPPWSSAPVSKRDVRRAYCPAPRGRSYRQRPDDQDEV